MSSVDGGDRLSRKEAVAGSAPSANAPRPQRARRGAARGRSHSGRSERGQGDAVFLSILDAAGPGSRRGVFAGGWDSLVRSPA